MHIRLSGENVKSLKQLVANYRKTDDGYDLSHAQQVNLLLRGRLKVALKESEQELKHASRRSRSKVAV